MIEKSLKSDTFSGTRSASKNSSAKAAATVKMTSGSAASSKAGSSGAQAAGAGSRLFEVEIAGVPLRLKSAHDEQTVNELIAFVDTKVREALPLTKTGSIQNAAILAALHLAEEYILLKRKAKLELENLEAKAQKVISELESSRVNTGLNNN